MAACPPGKVLNPRTLRCVAPYGRTAQGLLAAGNISAAEVGYAGYYPQTRQTRRAPRVPAANAFAAYWGYRVAEPRPQPLQHPLFRQARPLPAAAAVPRLFGAAAAITPCPPGMDRNPDTGRCIKIGGRTYKRLHRAEEPAAEPAAPAVAQPAASLHRRATSEAPARLPVGSATVVPLGDKTTMLSWADGNCSNVRDPLTGIQFREQEAAALQSMIRLHDRTCTLAPGLHRRVKAAHTAGDVATLPDGSAHMTLDDFRALRDAMRRTDPGYKLPGRKHTPPPTTWRLYVASDTRSGPEFASVLYVDTTKIRRTADGLEIPTQAVMVDMGFLPLDLPAGTVCNTQTIVGLLERLDKDNKLLMPVAGGWKPTAGFPFTKQYWAEDRAGRISRLCKELARHLAAPI